MSVPFPSILCHCGLVRILALVAMLGAGTALCPADVAQTLALKVLLPADAAKLSVNGEEFEGIGETRIITVTPGEAKALRVQAAWELNIYTVSRRFLEVPVQFDSEITVDLRQPPPDQPDQLEASYASTPEKVVEAMCRIAKVGPDDVVFDLGCGDGRLVITAVKNFQAKRGIGVDINPNLIRESKYLAEEAGVTDKCEFRVGDVLEIKDLSSATVVLLYMGDSINLRLRPILQKTLPLGARVVSHEFRMGDWEPLEQQQVVFDEGQSDIFLWVIDEETRRMAEEQAAGEKNRKDPPVRP